MDVVRFRIEGVAPLLLHNGQLADPLNEHAKALKGVTGKRSKTDEDHLEVAHLEYMGSMYWTEALGVHLPALMLESMLIGGAKKVKCGQQAKAGIIVEDDAPLLYDGPRTPEELWQSGRFVKSVSARVGTSRVMRTRPYFPEWACEFEVSFDAGQVNERQVRDFLVRAGDSIGIGDWRPRFGRFSVA